MPVNVSIQYMRAIYSTNFVHRVSTTPVDLMLIRVRSPFHGPKLAVVPNWPWSQTGSRPQIWQEAAHGLENSTHGDARDYPSDHFRAHGHRVGALAAAVTTAGGLGLIGGGYGDRDWIERELRAAGNVRVGVGFITGGWPTGLSCSTWHSNTPRRRSSCPSATRRPSRHAPRRPVSISSSPRAPRPAAMVAPGPP